MGDKKRLHDTGLLILLCTCALLLLMRIGYLFLADPERFPIKTVKISATYQHITRKQIAEILASYLDNSFFSLSVNRLRQDLAALNWAKQVSVERVWPDTLKIILVEKVPFAVWNNSLMTAGGELFQDNDPQLAARLPRLSGPAHQQSDVLQIYQKLSKLLASYGLQVASLDLRDNQAWELILANNIQLRLGKRDLEQRVLRFCKAYKAGFAEKPEQLSSVDLRYAHGMAVQWKQQTGR
ncbi:cell division protein FtsQ/DivIB [Legionella londiniensis]|uniref:Cell division protein FtsQ n=1 Tax=Legionella londiniensis TaxID=45068 RepID=A0A0W0VRE4_9GAMM|nr:cell division protein FtsQ/DivIB [Legionella londiniensis]KTD22716.1 cell division protein FtsQ [Legionella londiniensis]STX92455.1 cell division protein FtsQ [Legionella londiniensis]